MKKLLFSIILNAMFVFGYSQIDTISTNIYQNNSKIGIGISSPIYLLDLKANYSTGVERNLLRLQNEYDGSMAYTGIRLMTGEGTYGSVLQDYSINYTGSPAYDFAGFFNISNNSRGVMLHANSAGGVIKFYTGHDENAGAGLERMRITGDGKIGIGTENPLEKLDISGGLKVGYTENLNSGTIRWTGSDFEGFDGSIWKSFTGNSASATLWEQNGQDIYYQNGWVGVGNSPIYPLDIKQNISSGAERNLIRLQNEYNGNMAYTGIRLMTGDGSTNSVLQDYGINYTASPGYDFAGFFNIANNARGLMLIANSQDGVIKFYTGHDTINDKIPERMRLDQNGNLGIGTSEPEAKLHVADGDIYISDINRGIIMKSPDGNCWRGVLNNQGQLFFSQINCDELSSAVEEIDNRNQNNNSEVSIFPNPSDGSIYVDIQKYSGNKALKYEVYSLEGQYLESNRISDNISKIDLTRYSSGNYIIRILNSDGKVVATEKIIKK